MLGLSLAAYTYCSWDHMFPGRSAAAAPKKGPTITAAVMNRAFVVKLDRDPFNSIPVGHGLVGESAFAGASDGSKELTDVTLQGVMITLGERAAVINGKALHEGELMKTAGGMTLPPKRIGPGYCVVETAGRLVMLKVDDAASVSATASTDATKNANISSV